MKNLLKSLLCASLITLSFAACNKTRNENSEKKQVETRQSIKAMLVLNGYDRRTAYETLTPDEITEFWITHIHDFVASRNLNAAQTHVVNSLVNFIENTTLDEGAHNVIEEFQAAWLPDASLVFTQEEIFLLAYSLYDNVLDDYNGLVNAPGTGGGTTNPPKKCQCEIGSLFWACAMHPSQCTNIICLATTSCGFLLMSKCDGRCDVTKG